jgi:hypothetical protein
MILKKSQKGKAEGGVAKVSEPGEPFRVGRRITTTPVTELAEEAEKVDATSPAELKVRLSADIEHQAYIRLKTYSAVVRKPVVSIIQELIYANCQV